MEHDSAATSRRRELSLFLFLIVVLFPMLSVGLVAAYGFIVWIVQILGPAASLAP